MSAAEAKTGPRPLVVSAEWAAEHRRQLAYHRISYFVEDGTLILDNVASFVAYLLDMGHSDDEEAIDALAIRVVAGWMSHPDIRDALSGNGDGASSQCLGIS